MIVYAGKQFWNDFNNGDEALFEDAGLPRDSNKFKIQAWVQTRKQDFRTANSWIAANGIYQWAKLQAGQSVVTWNTAYMKDNYTADDFSFLKDFTALDGSTFDPSVVATWPNRLKSTLIWRPLTSTKNWDIVIWKSWVYAVTCQCVFIAPTWYSVSNSSSYKFYVGMIWNWQADMWTQWRWCWATDWHSVFYLGWFNEWDRLNVGFLHTYTTKPFLCQPSIWLYRLS